MEKFDYKINNPQRNEYRLEKIAKFSKSSNDYEITIEVNEDEHNVQKIEETLTNLKQQFPNCENFAIKIQSKKDYLFDENDVEKIVNIDEWCKQNNLKCSLSLNNYLADEKIQNFLIARKIVNDLADKINNFTYNEKGKQVHLSPFEKYMIIHQFTANRIYNQDEINDHNHQQRNWIGVLTSEFVICSGFASLLNCLCDKVFDEKDLKCFKQSSSVLDKNDNYLGGHANNLVYIKDEKYGIEGVYHSDSCWDSKRTDRDTTFNYCLIPLTQLMKDKNHNFKFSHYLFDKINLNKSITDYNDNKIENLTEFIGNKINSNAKFLKEDEIKKIVGDIDLQIEEMEKANSKIRNIVIDNFVKNSNIDLNFKVPLMTTKEFNEKHPQYAFYKNEIRNITLENLNDKKNILLIKEYEKYCKQIQNELNEQIHLSENLNNPFLEYFNNGSNEQNLLRDITSRAKLTYSENVYSFDFNKKLKDESLATLNQLKEEILEDKKHLLYADKISDEAFKQGLARVGLFNGVSNQNDLNDYVQKEFERLKLGEKEKFDLNEK